MIRSKWEITSCSSDQLEPYILADVILYVFVLDVIFISTAKQCAV